MTIQFFQAIAGCGHLLYEIIRGVNGKFHSCIDTFLPILLRHLKSNEEHQYLLFQVLTQTLTDSLQTIQPKEFVIFWNCILKYTEEILGDNNGDSKGLEYILRLAGQIIEHQNGKYLANTTSFILLLIKVICEQHNENVLTVCAQISTLLLLSPNISLSQEHASIIVKVLLPLPFPNILINFVQNVVKYSQFDLHILPQFLNFVVQSGFETEAMCTLNKICISKAPLCKNGINLFEWVKYPLGLGRGLPLFMEHVNNVIDIDNIDEILNNPIRCINVLICLPHVEKLDVDKCLNLLSTFIKKTCNILSSYNVEILEDYNNKHSTNTQVSKSIRKSLFLLGHAIECAIHVSSCRRLKEICDIENLLVVLLPFAADPNYLAALQIIDLYLTAYDNENALTGPFLSLVDSYLRDNVRSPYHIVSISLNVKDLIFIFYLIKNIYFQVRLLTTHIYKLFENIEEIKKSAQFADNVESFSIFSLCYSVESITPSIQEYRTQLNLLQKMAFNTVQYNLAKTTEFHLYSLNYMLGILYANFKLLWEPVIEFIAGYANALTVDEFWPIFHKALETSFTKAKLNGKQFQFDDDIDSNYSSFCDCYGEYNNILERPDLFNYRNLILKIMTYCIHVCEAKNRDVVTIFLNFIDEEYKKNLNNYNFNINIEVHGPVESIENKEDDENEQLTDADTVETISGKNTFKTLINIMQVISQFKNPRALHKEPIFWELYMEFLKHRNSGLQKYALECILNYKNKSVTPYKSNLYNLVDEKKFKDELTMFKITEDSENLKPEDRQYVIPIILRILYGKMAVKLGADKKGGGQTRRGLIMRYLAGCNETELKMFLEMAFFHYKHYMSMNPENIYCNIVANLNIKSVISPSKIQSALNLLEVVREYFGGYMKNELFAEYCKIFYAVISTIAAVLSQEDKVHKAYTKIMKNIRTTAISLVTKLFDQFDKYPWTKDELFVIFETLVWPILSKLHIEGVNSPTVLLKLLNTWCYNPRFYVLLITCPKDSSLSPLSAIFNLLQSEKVNPTVVNMILDMIEKLLTLSDDSEDDVPPIVSFNTLPLGKNENTDSLNFGSKIIIPYLTTILDVMKRRLANSAKSATVNKRDLLILSRITELVNDSNMCEDLLHLLVPILVKKVCMNMAEENMEYSVNAIINLLQNCDNPQKYIKDIAILFNKVSPVDIRKLLCKLLVTIAEKNGNKNLIILADVINGMNAFNKRWIEQPDFDKRLDTYKQIYELSENNNIDVDLGILIVNNCFYSIRTEKDIGLRDSAGLCLKKILPKLLLKYKSTSEGQFLVRDTILSLISTGIRDTKNDILRNESIALLGELARECPDADVVLADLECLTNKEDREVDFFENMCHLQMHRRVRALLKFSKTFKKQIKCPVPRTLTNFILPLASMYLCDDKYSDKNTLIDAAIEVISTCCRLLPWYHYELILKHYLNKLRSTTDHQKQLTRILIGIVDSFHFDFSKVKHLEMPKALVASVKLDTNKMNVVEANKNIKNSDEVEDNDDETQSETGNLETDLQIDDDEAENDDDDVTKEISTLPAFERITSVSPSVAKRIIKSLTSGLLPQMNR